MMQARSVEPQSGPRAWDRLTVADVMTLDPVTIAVDDPIEDAERMLQQYRISGLPVVDAHGALVGVISQSDLLANGSPTTNAILRRHASGLRVGELMSSPAITVRMSDRLSEAAIAMRDNRVHRLIAVDEHGRSVGVLSAFDFAVLFADG